MQLSAEIADNGSSKAFNIGRVLRNASDTFSPANACLALALGVNYNYFFHFRPIGRPGRSPIRNTSRLSQRWQISSKLSVVTAIPDTSSSLNLEYSSGRWDKPLMHCPRGEYSMKTVCQSHHTTKTNDKKTPHVSKPPKKRQEFWNNLLIRLKTSHQHARRH